MRVRILSGSQTGAVVEMSQPEGESAIATGYAEAYTAPEPEPAPEPAPKRKPEPRKRDEE